MGGAGFYSARVVPYLEPVFQNHECYKEIYTKGMCPVAEDLQKKIKKIKNNNISLAEAQKKANILRKLILKIEYEK